MKKTLALLLALTMIFALAACGGGKPAGGSGAGDPTSSTSGAEEPNNGGGKGGILTEDGECTQQQMEDTIVSYFSDVTSLSSLTLCGGSSIYYEADDMITVVDIWTINDPDMSYEDFVASMKEQLSDGFEYEANAIGGHDWTVTVGDKEMWIELRPLFGDSGYFLLCATPEAVEPK